MTSISSAYTITGAGPPLFLIHGIGSRRQSWDGLVKILKNSYQCISYDLRGHGESPLPTSPFGLKDLVEDLERLREELNLPRAHFAGISLGGMIGPAYARAYPNRVETLTMLSTAAFRTSEDRQKLNTLIAAIESRGLEPLLDTLVTRWFTEEFIQKSAAVIETRKQQLLSMDLGVFLNVFRIYADTEMAPWLHEINTPTLVITGELDGGCSPRLNAQIAAALPNSKYHVLEGLKHNIVLEAPDRVGVPLLSFLSSRRYPESVAVEAETRVPNKALELTKRFSIDASGVLQVEGVSTLTLAEKYGTPLFVLSENTIRDNYKTIYGAFSRRYDNEVIICAGMKGNFGLASRKVIVEEGGGGDAFGVGELMVAMMAGSDPRKIVMNGTNKQPDTIAAAIDAGVLIQVDCLEELDDIEQISSEMGQTARLSLRVRLPLTTLSHVLYKDPRYPDGISPTLWETTFKFGMEPEALYRAVQRALKIKNASLEGLMYHGGIPRRAGFFREETAELMDIVGEIRKRFGWQPTYLNIGGGFVPVRMGADKPPSMEDYASGICDAILSKCREHNLLAPVLMMEPGRYCWDSAGIWLTRVGVIKDDTTLAKRKWVYVDGNTNEMGDPFDPYSRVHQVVIANDAKRMGEEIVDVCGGTCNAADILAKQRELPPLMRGDLIAFMDMGAYNESFAHQSNAIPRSATVMVSDGRAAVVRRRETVQDVLARDTIPSWLLRPLSAGKQEAVQKPALAIGA